MKKFLSLCLVLYSTYVYAGVNLIKDIDVNGKRLPKGTDLVVFSTQASNWYQVFGENKGSLGYLLPDCVSIKDDSLTIIKDCELKKSPYIDSKTLSTVTKNTKFNIFKLDKTSESVVMYNGVMYHLPTELLRVTPPNIDPLFFEEATIEQIVKLKKEKMFVSPYIDRTIYVSSDVGVFASFNGRKWYRLKKLEQKKYEIGVTEEGWLLADNMVSKDYGMNFIEFFPSHAFPYNDAYVKSIVISPQGGNAIYMTFSTPVDSSEITLFVLSDITSGWKRIYPTVDGKIVTVPVEDGYISILSFINNSWLHNNSRSNKGKIDLEDIELTGDGRSRGVTMLIKTYQNKKRNYHVSLLLNYENEKGWVVKKETWRTI